MELSENVEESIADNDCLLRCVRCKDPYSLVVLCKSFHYVCYECQREFPRNCPHCMEEYVSQDSVLLNLDTILESVNEVRESSFKDNSVYGNLQSISNAVVTKKKTPADECKEYFFRAVWDSLSEALFSGWSSKNGKRKQISIAQSLSKILSKVTRKMGKSVYGMVLAKYPQDKKNIQISLGLLLLLIGSQLIMKKAFGTTSYSRLQS